MFWEGGDVCSLPLVLFLWGWTRSCRGALCCPLLATGHLLVLLRTIWLCDLDGHLSHATRVEYSLPQLPQLLHPHFLEEDSEAHTSAVYPEHRKNHFGLSLGSPDSTSPDMPAVVSAVNLQQVSCWLRHEPQCVVSWCQYAPLY